MIFKILFVSGDDGVTSDGFCEGRHKAVFKILRSFLVCGQNIVIGNAAHFYDFQHLPNRLIGEFGAVGVFFDQIVNVGHRGTNLMSLCSSCHAKIHAEHGDRWHNH